MVTGSIVLTALIRVVLVLLFLPFSALDKVLNFRGAVTQARETAPSDGIARMLIVTGFCVEVFMSLGVITGIADRLCAFVLGGYCGMTALFWKQFWRPGDFWQPNDSKARALFWDFLKNFALGAGFLLIAFGTTASSVHELLANPGISSHPYQVSTERTHE